MYNKICATIIVHIILLILGEIWSEGSNLTTLVLVEVFDEVARVNVEALNIKSCQPQQKHCQEKAEANCIFIVTLAFICHDKKCCNARAGDWTIVAII